MPLPGASPEDLSYIDKLDQVRSRSNVPTSIATAQNVANLARTYPGMSPGLVASLGQSGIGPGQQAQEIWQKELASKLGRTPGQTVKVQTKGERDARGKALVKQLGQGGFNPIDAATGVLSDAASHLPGFLKPGNDFLAGNQPGQPDPLNVQHSGEAQVVQDATKAVTRTVGAAGQAGLEGVTGLARQNFGIQSVDPIGDTTGVGPGTRTNPNAIGVGDNTPLTLAENTAAQTTLGQMVEGHSAGDGYLPAWNSPAMKAQAEAARQFSPYLVNGHAWTLGRDLASHVFEQDDDKYQLLSGLIDASVALSKADPTSAALRAVGDLNKSRNTFATVEEAARSASDAERASAGAINGVRKIVSVPEAIAFSSGSGAAVYSHLAQAKDEFSVHHNFNIPYYVDGDPVAAKIAAATTPDEVFKVLQPHIGLGITDVPTYTPTLKSRLLSDVPDRTFPTARGGDMNAAAKNADNYLLNMGKQGGITLDDRKYVAHMWANAGDSPTARYAAVEATSATLEKALVGAGIDPDKAALMMKRETNLLTEAQDYGTDAMGEPLINKNLLSVDGKPHDVPHPLFDNQFLNSNVKFPDPHELRAATSTWAPLVNSAPWKMGVAGGDAMMSVWRKVNLFKPALGAHILADSQLRQAALGGASFFTHPLDMLANIVGNPDRRWLNTIEDWSNHLTSSGRANQALQEARKAGVSFEDIASGKYPDLAALEEKAGGAHKLTGAINNIKNRAGHMTMTPSGESFSSFPSYYESIQGHGSAPAFSALWDQNPKMYLHEFTNVDTTGEHGARALAEELSRTHEARIGRGVASAATPEEAKAAFWDGDLASVRTHMADDPTMASLRDSRPAADAQIDLITKRLSAITADNPTLVEAIRTGAINGTPLADPWGHVTDAGAAEVQKLIDAGETLPPKVRARKFVTLSQTDKDKHLARLRSTFNYAFDAMVPRPINYLSKSPFNREMTWNHAADLFPELGASDRATMIQHAGEAKLGKDYIQRLTHLDTSIPAPDAPRITLPQLNELAMKRAGDDTVERLHDLSSRSQIADMARIMVPFGESWKQIATQWAKIAFDNPQVFRRADQGIMGARSPGSNVINTATGGTPLGDGFIFKDQYGQESFAWPGSEWMSNALIGQPVPLTGSVRGLNMVTSGLPGLGLAASIPLSYFLPDKPAYDDLTNLLFPHGRNGTNPVTALQDSFVPGWMKSIRTAMSNPNSTREFATAVKDTANYLASTGDYRLNGPDARTETARLMADAKSGARNVYLLRAFASAAIPASPSPQWLVHDKSGNLTTQWQMYDQFNKWVTKDGYDGALQKYFNYFGTDNYLLLQGTTKAKSTGLDQLTTNEGSAWGRDHPDLASKFPTTYGLFAPPGQGFDYAEYQRQFDNGQRDPLTPQEMIDAANNRLAGFVYARAKTNMGTKISSTEQSQLTQLRGQLRDDFPGYAPTGGTKIDPVNQMSELYRATADPTIAATEAGKALTAYLEHRNTAIAAQQKAGLGGEGLSSAKANDANRAWLNDWGTYLLDKYPQFQPVWDQVLSREVK